VHFHSTEIVIMVLEIHVNVDIMYLEMHANVKTQGHLTVQNVR
jgi:hypothetical protein